MKEDLLQFAWQYKLIKPGVYHTVKGTVLEILHPGEKNTNEGADFFNAKIKLGNLILAGNIELHVKTSDWIKHHHEQNRSYDNIILHVVYEHDREIEQNQVFNVEVFELKKHFPKHIVANYTQLIKSKSKIPCEKNFSAAGSLSIESWISRMTVERVEKKREQVKQVFDSCNGDYSQTFYTLLLRNFGFNVNAQPFEMLAKAVPLATLLKHSNQLLQLEALLLGGAGFLGELSEDKYIQQLQNEFSFLAGKYKIIPLKKELFKQARMRPANFPSLRLAQFASLIHTQTHLFTHLQNPPPAKELVKQLQVNTSEYWKNHYKTGVKTNRGITRLGKESAEILLINAFSNFYFFYGRMLGKEHFESYSLELLDELNFENNSKTKLFPNISEKKQSAFHSQGLIHLFDNYCAKKRCLHCGIGNAILKKDNLM